MLLKNPRLLSILCLLLLRHLLAPGAALGQAPDAALRAAPASPPTGPAAAIPPTPTPAPGMKAFSTQGHRKARGLHLSLQYPRAWTTWEPRMGPEIQVFDDDNGPYSFSLTAAPVRRRGEAPLTAAAAAALLTPAGIMRSLRDEGGGNFTLLRGEQTTFAGQPACRLVYSFPMARNGQRYDLFAGFFFIRHGIMVVLGGTSWRYGEADVPRRSQELEAALNSIVQTLVDHGGEPPPEPPSALDTWLGFSTAGHPKAAGLQISLKYPSTWQAQESDTPEIIQRFQSPKQNIWAELIHVGLVPGAAPLTQEAIDAFLDPARLKTQATEGEITSSHTTSISGMTATRHGFIDYAPQVGPGAESRMGHIYHFIVQGHHFNFRLVGSAQDKKGETALGYQVQQSENDFHLMANTLLSQAPAPPAAPPPTPYQPAIPALSPPLQEPAAIGAVTSVPIFSRESSPFSGAGHLVLLPALCGVLTLLSLSRYLRGRDKDAPQGRYLPGRVAYLGWHLVVLAIVAAWVLVINLVFAVPQVVGSITMGVGLCVGLAYLSIRRLEDIGWSPWLAALALVPVLFFLTLWLPLRLPTQIFALGALALCFIPGRPRAGDPAPGQATTTAAEDLPPEPEETEAAAETPTHPAFEPEIEIESEATETSEYASAPATTAATAPRTLPAPPSLITLWQAGQTYGPYPAPEVLRLWDAGQVAGNASYWREGMPDYRPLAPAIDHLRTLVETGRSQVQAG